MPERKTKKSGSLKAEKANIYITGMTCTTCAETIRKGLADAQGVSGAEVSFASEKATVN